MDGEAVIATETGEDESLALTCQIKEGAKASPTIKTINFIFFKPLIMINFVVTEIVSYTQQNVKQMK